MKYSEFITKLEKARQCILNKNKEEIEDLSKILFTSTHRRIFVVSSQVSGKVKLSIEVISTINSQYEEEVDQEFLTSQLHTIIDLLSYLLKLQKNSFLLDLLPEENIWYATIELENLEVSEQLFKLLNLDEKAF